jgi:hypothetical protein
MMSKQINRFCLVLAALVVVTTALAIKHTAGAAGPQRTAVANSAVRNAAIVATTEAVLKETSEIRELPVLKLVKSGAQSRTQIERMLIKNLNEQTTAAEMHATEVTLRKLGLAPSDFEYRPFIIKLLTEQVAGYYDPRAQEFHLADWLELEGQKPVMAHELTHALQDQHFNLKRFEKWPHGDSDAELAVHALVEGDATLAMTIYMAKNPLVALAFSRSISAGALSSVQYYQAPRAMRESLIFPYMQGMEWSTQLYKRGGWSMVSKAFTRLPLSSEHILHAEKYFSYEVPVKVSLPDVSALLNSDGGRSRRANGIPTTASASRRPAGWKRLDYDVNGEWSYYLILDQFVNSPAESKRAAAGWAGDRMAVYEGSQPGQVFIAQSTVWDTENDAREFFDTYVKRTELRYRDAESTPFPVPLDSQVTDIGRAWRTSEGGVVVELRGTRVLILEGVPDGVDSNSVLRALWR